MVLFSLHVYNRGGDAIFRQEWARAAPANPEGEQHLHALATVMHDILSKLPADGDGAGAKALTTSHYKLHVLNTLTGYRFIMLTDPTFGTADGQEVLRRVYEGPFVEAVAACPSYEPHAPGKTVTIQHFPRRLRQLLIELHMVAADAA